jgi:hypothetical protein
MTGDGLSTNSEQSQRTVLVIVSFVATSIVMRHIEGTEGLLPPADTTHNESPNVELQLFNSVSSIS